MVNRTKISKEIYRRAGGVGKTGNGTKVEDLKPKDWEQVPGTGGSPHNPPRFRLTKEAKKRQQTKFKLKVKFFENRKFHFKSENIKYFLVKLGGNR